MTGAGLKALLVENKIKEMATQSSLGILFTKLEKFSDTDSTDLVTWIRNFERCCIIAGKTDDMVKGQLLMLFVEGKAKAILEELEESNGGDPQTFSTCKTALEGVFDTVASREAKMAAFETRVMQIQETEEEFMLELTKLYRAANPTITGKPLQQTLKAFQL